MKARPRCASKDDACSYSPSLCVRGKQAVGRRGQQPESHPALEAQQLPLATVRKASWSPPPCECRPARRKKGRRAEKTSVGRGGAPGEAWARQRGRGQQRQGGQGLGVGVGAGWRWALGRAGASPSQRKGRVCRSRCAGSGTSIDILTVLLALVPPLTYTGDAAVPLPHLQGIADNAK